MTRSLGVPSPDADSAVSWLPASWRLAGAAALLLSLSGMPALAEGEDTGDSITIEGALTEEGVTCPALRGDDGELYTLAGEIGDLQSGQRVRVTGEVAEMSMCMQGTTIAVSDIAPLPE